ncbi:uncharacterized protein LOC117167779 isoform X2 [Belonocnema kinseyi]|uniref:uncharacterized protein LOC117167779 isoform X2 n=1 Tax=Belonocnema kinseyi TaxID=2817044 RepID=UPI00143D0583|nr:uncharacterized protein LOC117167779 isoform X2 [Belonocnema kinseyi]
MLLVDLLNRRTGPAAQVRNRPPGRSLTMRHEKNMMVVVPHLPRSSPKQGRGSKYSGCVPGWRFCASLESAGADEQRKHPSLRGVEIFSENVLEQQYPTPLPPNL